MKLPYLLTIICFSYFSFGQKKLSVNKLTDEVVIDGIMDEGFWTTADVADDFVQYFPSDTVPAFGQSELKMFYDDKRLIIGIKCYGKGNDWVVNSLKRDYRAGGIDNMTLVFDAFQDKTNAYFFGINAEGVIREGVITNGGNDFRDFDESWDNKWKGEAQKFDGYYTAELEIPFSSLRYKSGSQQWNFDAYRYDAQYNEWSTWTGTPRIFPMTNLAYHGTIEWEEPLKPTSGTISVIPFVTAGVSKNHEEGTETQFTRDIGGDVKVAVTSGLNLDLTINPDFSQVEVDRQITDLSRFEIFFPERRQFFLENADLFSGFGFSNINPFFSRRIGVSRDKNDDLVQNRIYAGARLSGKVNDDMRIGLLNMQTGSVKEEGVFATNYTVAAVQQKVMDRSNIGFMMVNKQVLGIDEANAFDITRHNRVAGIDFNFADKNNMWIGKTFLHGSLSDGEEGVPISHGLELAYNSRTWVVGWRHEYVDEDYDAQVGFIRRKDYFQINPNAGYQLFPAKGMFNNITMGVDAEFVFRPEIGKSDHEITMGMRAQTRDNARFDIGVSHQYIFLTDAFDPTGTDSETLPAMTGYNYINVSGSYGSDRRKPVSFFIRPSIGAYFNGRRYGVRGRLTFVAKPKAQLAIDMNYNYFDMPHLDGSRETFLLGPRLDYTFSKKLFFTTIVQYNTQSENTNINARLQWRFAPVSDFFLVFTDNYFTGSDISDRFAINIRNRAIVAKLTYWLNT